MLVKVPRDVTNAESLKAVAVMLLLVVTIWIELIWAVVLFEGPCRTPVAIVVIVPFTELSKLSWL